MKLPLTLAIILALTLTPSGAWPIYLALGALIWSLVLLSSVGMSFVLKRSLLALPFALAALPLIFHHGDAILWRLPWGWAVRQEGLVRLAGILLKSWLSLQAAILLAATTPTNDLLLSLRAIGVPRLLVAIFALMWRYLFVLVEEASRLMRAREARSGATNTTAFRAGGSLAWRARVTGGMAGNLFLRSLDRGDRVHAAMMARGYDGEVRVLAAPRLRSDQIMVLAVGIAGVGLLALAGWIGWG